MLTVLTNDVHFKIVSPSYFCFVLHRSMAILFYEFLSLPHCVSPQRRLIFMVQDVFIHLCKREKNEKTTKIYIFISCLGLLEIKETQQQWPFSLAQLQPSARHCRKKRIPNGFKIHFFCLERIERFVLQQQSSWRNGHRPVWHRLPIGRKTMTQSTAQSFGTTLFFQCQETLNFLPPLWIWKPRNELGVATLVDDSSLVAQVVSDVNEQRMNI